MDVGVLGNVLNAFLNAPEAVAGNAEAALDAFVVGVSFPDLSGVEFEDESNELANGNDARAECDGALMIDCEPPDGLADVSTASSVRLHGEIPNASGAGNHELLASVEEVGDPKESKNLQDKNVTGVVLPHNFSKE